MRHTRPARRQRCRGPSVCFARYSCTRCQSVQKRSTNCLCYEPTGVYAVCRICSRCSTGEGNQCRQRGSRQPRYNFDEGSTRLVSRSPRPWCDFGEANPHSQRRSPRRAEIRRWGYAFRTPPPSTMAREPALHAPLPPATRRAAMRLLRRRVTVLSERVHPLLSLTMWWRSV